LWFGCHEVAKTHTEAVQRALGGEPAPHPAVLGERLFRKLVESRSGTAFTHHTEVWSLLAHTDKKVHLAIPEMFEWVRKLDPASVIPDPEYPYVLSAGQRRLQNANQILRDPAPKRADPDGALYIHPDDLVALGVQDKGCVVVESKQGRMIVRAHATDTMRRGHVILPHGYGQLHPTESGQRIVSGPAVNWLTDSDSRDPVADTPHHKFVPSRLYAAPAGAAVGAFEPLLEEVVA
jgi:anaerobic selenocysteine-containing dehydrogenase